MAEPQIPVYKRLDLSVRPARLAVVLPPLEDWQTGMMRMLENLSRVWGGLAHIVIRLDDEGKLRGDPWSLVRLHDADRFGVYQPTFRGLQIEDEADFEEWLAREAARLAEEAEERDLEGMKEMLREDHVLETPRYRWKPPDELGQQLLRQMSPFHSEDHVFSEHVRDEWVPGNHFVDIARLEPVSDTPIVFPDASMLPPELALLFAARAGALSPAHEQVLGTLGIEVRRVPITE